MEWIQKQKLIDLVKKGNEREVEDILEENNNLINTVDKVINIIK